jgi:hypothetical protein
MRSFAAAASSPRTATLLGDSARAAAANRPSSGAIFRSEASISTPSLFSAATSALVPVPFCIVLDS